METISWKQLSHIYFFQNRVNSFYFFVMNHCILSKCPKFRLFKNIRKIIYAPSNITSWARKQEFFYYSPFENADWLKRND